MSKALKICLVLLLVAATSQAAVFKVKDGGTAPFFSNLDTALWTAQHYGAGPHQVQVYAGTYNTDIDLLVPGNVDAITGMEPGVLFEHPTPPTWISLADNFLDVKGSVGLTISGLHVKGYNGGIVTTGAMAIGLTVEDCVFEDCIVGVYAGANGGTFGNLQIFGGWMGIGINSLNAAGGEAIDDNVISNCTVYGIRRAPAIFFHYDEDFFVPGPTNMAASLNGNQVIDCSVYECADHGIALAGATGTVIDGCDIYDVQFAGIAAWGAAGGTISDNSIHQVAQGSINPDSTALTWGSPLGAISFYGTTGLTVSTNSVFDNGGLGSMGDGAAFAEYAAGADAASTGNTFTNNCFFDHDGVQAQDFGGNTWDLNYYSDLTASPYLIDGGTAQDNNPKLFNASANTAAASYEVWDVIDMTFDWSLPDCDPIDDVGLASYEFTVTYDPAKLRYVANSGGYNEGFLGDTAFYAPIDDATPGLLTFGAANFLAPGYGNASLAFGQFEVIGFGATTVTLASLYQDSLNQAILVNNTPLNLTLTDTQAPTITVVADNPVGDDTYSDLMDIDITGDVTDNFDLYRVYYRLNSTGSWLTVETVSGMIDTYGPFTVDLVGLADGPHVLNMRVRDDAGNYGFADYNFTVDNTAPVLTSITLSDPTCAVDPNYTNEPTVAVTIVDDGTATEMQFALPGFPEGFIPYVNPTTYTLPSVDGTYSLYLQLKDAYGNAMLAWPVFDQITLDQVATAPTTQWILSNPTPTYTTTANVMADANFGYPTNYEYVITVDPTDLDCNSGAWTVLPDAGNRPVALTLPGGDGVKTVYFGARDLAGNIASVTQTITLDQAAPAFLSFDLPACANITNPIATFTWDGTADPDVKYIHLSVVSGGPYPVMIDVSAQDPSNASVAVPLAVGTYTVYAVLEDNAGNMGTEVSDVVVIDQTLPDAGTPRINANAAWTNSATVTVALTGAFSADITEIRMTQVSGNYSLPQNNWQPYVGNPGISYTFNPVTEDVNSNLYVQVRDCAGNVSTEKVDAIRIDLTNPVISTVSINGGAAWTNNPAVSVAMINTELRPYQVFLSEDPGMSGAVMFPYGGPYPFTLTGPDDVSKPVYVQMSDLAGNLSNVMSDDIGLDRQAPTGSFNLVQTSNPLAAPGFTNALVIDIKGIVFDADVVNMAFAHGDLTGNTGWIAPAGEYLNWSLQAGPDGLRTVKMALLDAAGNMTLWTLSDDIYYDVTAPLTGPAGFTVTPSGSCDLTWIADPNDQYYFFRFNASFEYPVYQSGIPPFPADSEGFAPVPFEPIIGTTYHFDADVYPEMDMLSFSLWSVDKAGNMSAAPSYASGVNYIPGDFDWDGAVEFLEFGDIAAAYLTNPNTKPHADIAAAVTDDPLTIPLPLDGVVSFPDLNKFAQNYVNYGDFGGKAAKTAPLGPVAISAEFPDYIPAGSEYTFSLTADDLSAVLAYHLVLDIDNANFEIVSVEQGAMYEDGMKAFFFHNAANRDLEIDGAVFGSVFRGEEIAQVTVRARNGASFNLSEKEIVAMGAGNEQVTVTFTSVRKEGLLPVSFTLNQNYPNPFNPTTTISFDVPRASEYTLTIFNLAGQVVTTFSGTAEPGVVSVDWNAESVASGVYFYRLEVGDFTASKKMVLLK